MSDTPVPPSYSPLSLTPILSYPLPPTLQNIREIEARLALLISSLFVTIEATWADAGNNMYSISRYAGKSASTYIKQRTLSTQQDFIRA